MQVLCLFHRNVVCPGITVKTFCEGLFRSVAMCVNKEQQLRPETEILMCLFVLLSSNRTSCSSQLYHCKLK